MASRKRGRQWFSEESCERAVTASARRASKYDTRRRGRRGRECGVHDAVALSRWRADLGPACSPSADFLSPPHEA
eukprot:scaffold237_cov52-Phaeocystis_antarctica.AAC.4